MNRIILSDDISNILKLMKNHGKAYIVGGFIRDSLMGVKAGDCDFCTDIPYDKLIEIFKDYNVKEIGKSFGIIQIRYNSINYEIAKLRKDMEFSTNRSDTTVNFIEDIKEDLSRRDFTVNAIACDGENIITVSDYSLKDIESKTIRFIGNASMRIIEDPLRILRAIRIFSEKSFKTIESESLKAMLDNSEFLKYISAERIRIEFRKIVMGDNFYNSLDYLNKLSLFNWLFPSGEILSSLPKNFDIRIFFLFEEIGFKELEKLLYSKKIIHKYKLWEKSIKKLDSIKEIDENNRKIIKIIMNDNVADIENLITIIKLKNNINYNYSKIISVMDSIIADREAYTAKDLNINGNDLIEYGVEDKNISKVLKNLASENLSENKNNKEYLLEILAKSL